MVILENYGIQLNLLNGRNFWAPIPVGNLAADMYSNAIFFFFSYTTLKKSRTNLNLFVPKIYNASNYIQYKEIAQPLTSLKQMRQTSI